LSDLVVVGDHYWLGYGSLIDEFPCVAHYFYVWEKRFSLFI